MKHMIKRENNSFRIFQSALLTAKTAEEVAKFRKGDSLCETLRLKKADNVNLKVLREPCIRS
jgi:hypothetical protein